MKRNFLILLLFISAYSLNFAQSKRSLINEGVDLYKKNKYADAEINFKKGLEKDNNMYQGHFNLGDAYYKQGRYDEAIQSFKNSLAFTENNNDKAKVYHNIGNSLLKSQKFPESIEAYKNSLKLNPDDLETKYNLSYALNMMKQDQNKQQQQNKDNKDQNKDQQQQQQNQNQNQNDQNKNQEKQNQNQQQQQQPKNEISKNDAERILEALKNNERDLQKKLRQVKGQPVVREKDW
ncbi:MAG: tetratricopeptide repeat protein [Ignavibacteria bacterium]|nr:tetratricopeptide repeat protein [Ignavibacteria bacterium]